MTIQDLHISRTFVISYIDETAGKKNRKTVMQTMADRISEVSDWAPFEYEIRMFIAMCTQDLKIRHITFPDRPAHEFDRYNMNLLQKIVKGARA